MTGSDRPEPIDPADDSWPQEDPDLTRVVPMGTPTGAPVATDAASAAAPGTAAAAAETAAANADDAASSAGQAADSASRAADAASTQGGQAAAGAAGWSSAGSVASSWSAGEPAAAPAAAPSYAPEPTPAPAAPSYTPEPTPSYGSDPAATVVAPTPVPYSTPPTTYTPPPASTGPGYAAPAAAMGAAAGAAAASDYQGGYGTTPSYQQPYPSAPQPAAPQVIMPPATNVILPPTKIPQAESRVGINAIGTVLGILLVFGGMVLVLRFITQIHDQTGAIDWLNFTWVVIGAILVALPALFVAWASWTALVPGLLVTGLTIWAMVTPADSGGAYYVDKATGWAFGDLTLGQFAYTGQGLLVGLPLLFAGLAAVFLRSGVRRTIVSQVESLQQ